jgi:hypothetical protein
MSCEVIQLPNSLSHTGPSLKCNFYRHIYDIHRLQFYLSRPVNYMYKPLICKYRIHVHAYSLKIETGRYLNIDRQEVG